MVLLPQICTRIRPLLAVVQLAHALTQGFAGQVEEMRIGQALEVFHSPPRHLFFNPHPHPQILDVKYLIPS